ncbi:MAG TPA: serine/threonine-protein kinase, partial [Planctomycetaceae bacterium]|nr:serine/threonine-protein kinase [Planctomycetaceae bacterium]
MEAFSKQTAAAESLDRERVIDSIVADFEAAWRGTIGQEPRIEDLLTQTKEIPAEILFPRLLAIELEQLKTRNILPDPDSYYRRFPSYTNVLDTIFSRSSNTGKSSQVSSETPCESLETFSRVIDSSTEFADGAQLLIREPGHQEEQARAIGDYQILDVLGQGGMGIVYRAYQTSAGRVVALKLIRPERLERHSEEKRRQIELRFETEAKSVARLQHDNLLQVYDVGVENGVHYFSMQYVEGKSLSQIIRDAPLSNRKAAEYLEQITRAVAEAHRNGILHRDLKPENILVDMRTDRPLLADFGLAKLLEEDVSATAAGEVFGSPPYMSPEQASDSASVTVSGDVYSLGATLYCMLTGRPPFQAATLVETLRQVVNDDAVSPRELNPAIDLDLETICLKCLEKEPSRRYSTAEALADDLGRYLRREPVLARPLGRFARFCRLCMRNKLVTTLASLAVVFLLSAMVILFLKNVEITDKNIEITNKNTAVTDALGKAQAALKDADNSFDELRATVDRSFTRISEETLLNQPGMQNLRKDLLTYALASYQKIVNSKRNTP